MRSFRSLVLHGADALALASQSALQSFGFLSANRESVRERDGARGLVATLPDKRDEGWPAVELALPPDASFWHATSAILSRTAIWSTSEPPGAVLARVTANAASDRTTVAQHGPYATVTLHDLAATIRVGTGSGGTMVAVRQRRHPNDVPDVLSARAAVR